MTVPSRCMDGKAAPAKPGLSCKHVSRMPWVWVTAERQDTLRAQPGCCCTTHLSEAWKGQAQPPMSLGLVEPPTGPFCSLLCFLFTQQGRPAMGWVPGQDGLQAAGMSLSHTPRQPWLLGPCGLKGPSGQRVPPLEMPWGWLQGLRGNCREDRNLSMGTPSRLTCPSPTHPGFLCLTNPLTLPPTPAQPMQDLVGGVQAGPTLPLLQRAWTSPDAHMPCRDGFRGSAAPSPAPCHPLAAG